MKKIKILLTGFEPFQGEVKNPSKEILSYFKDRYDTLVLPVSFARSFEVLSAKLQTESYDFVLMMGQAGGRRSMSLERLAINLIDTDKPDEDGKAWLDRPIQENGPSAMITDLPIRDWCQRGRNLKLPFEISNTAGLFVCNSLYYRVMQLFCSRGNSSKTLFLHLPYMTEQLMGKSEGTPSLHLDLMKQGVQFLLDEVVEGLRNTKA